MLKNPNRKATKASSTRGLPGPADPIPHRLTREEVLALELQDHATDGALYNRVFRAYTRRKASGVVDEPQNIFANEALVRRTSDDFDKRVFEICALIMMEIG